MKIKLVILAVFPLLFACGSAERENGKKGSSLEQIYGPGNQQRKIFEGPTISVPEGTDIIDSAQQKMTILLPHDYVFIGWSGKDSLNRTKGLQLSYRGNMPDTGCAAYFFGESQYQIRLNSCGLVKDSSGNAIQPGGVLALNQLSDRIGDLLDGKMSAISGAELMPPFQGFFKVPEVKQFLSSYYEIAFPDGKPSWIDKGEAPPKGFKLVGYNLFGNMVALPVRDIDDRITQRLVKIGQGPPGKGYHRKGKCFTKARGGVYYCNH